MYGLRDRRRKDWVWFEKSVIQRLENDAQVATYVALLILSAEGSIVWASQDTIARVAHNSVRTVARTLPELERLQVIRRASDETLERLAERLGEIPATIVYELVSVEMLEEPEREPDDERPLREQTQEVAGQRAAVVAIVRKWLSKQSRRNIDFGWLVRLYNQAGTEDTFVWAAEKTATAKPRGEWLAFMGRVIQNAQQEPQQQPDLSKSTEEAFKWD